MNLPNSLLKEFAEVTNDDTKQQPTDSKVYGTAIYENDTLYIQIDGASTRTPATPLVNVANNDRVMAEIHHHKALIIGNITRSEDAANNERIDRLETETVKTHGDSVCVIHRGEKSPGTNGEQGWVRAVRIIQPSTSTYRNQTVTICCRQRHYVTFEIEILFKNSTTPGLIEIDTLSVFVRGVIGTDRSTYPKVQAYCSGSVCSIYIYKIEAWDQINVTDIYCGSYLSGTEFEFPNDLVSPPSGSVEANRYFLPIMPQEVESTKGRNALVLTTNRYLTGYTLPQLVNDIRRTNGCIGSWSNPSEYTLEGCTIGASTWWNFIYIPHRDGGYYSDSANYGTLLLFGMNSNQSVMYRVGFNTSGTVTVLRRLSEPTFSSVTANSNMNAYTTVGIYYVGTNATAEGLTNIPVKYAGKLTVETVNGNREKLDGTWAYIRQTYEATNNTAWTRIINTGSTTTPTYGTWKQIY